MNKTRTLLELLKLMLRYTKTEKNYYGLCGTVCDLFNRELITGKERSKLDTYIYNNPPQNRDHSHGYFFWKKRVKAPRIRWQKEHIKKQTI